MRHRYRLLGLRAARLAHAPHDADLRFERPGEACVYPQLRLAGPGAGLDGSGADRIAWSDVHRAERQPRVLWLWHRRERHRANRRPGKAFEGTEGTDPGQPGLSAGGQARSTSGRGCAHDLPAAGYATRRICQAKTTSRVRCCTHSSNENFTPIYYKRVLFIAHFNAGVRALDIRDPLEPKEIAYYIPAITDKTDKRCVGTGADQRCKVAIQTNNVDVDDRGYIYIVDRANTGMHILELTGAARQIANFDPKRVSEKR